MLALVKREGRRDIAEGSGAWRGEGKSRGNEIDFVAVKVGHRKMQEVKNPLLRHQGTRSN